MRNLKLWLVAAALGFALPAFAEEVTGTLANLHSDDFATGKATHQWVIHEDNGKDHKVKIRKDHEKHLGKKVRAKGNRKATKGVQELEIDELEVLALPQAVLNNNVLFVAVTFTDAGAPFTTARLQESALQLSAFFAEGSYGKETMNPTVTPWLAIPMARAAGCDFTTVGNLADAAANAAGFNVASFSYRFYVMPTAPCGWTGLAYIGYGRAWSNGSDSVAVMGHEYGHNRGLSHAGRANAIGPNQGVSEYGDISNTMGNRKAGHYAATEKLVPLQWLTTTQVPTYAGGTQRYTLTPMARAGGSTYGVIIPTPNPNRTYSVEYRLPIGFDAGICANSACTQDVVPGLQLRLWGPFESVSGQDDTQFLTMIGSSYTDPDYPITISLVSSDTSVAVVQVSNAALPPPPPLPPPPINAALTNGSFETPAVTSFAYSPTGSSWVFGGGAGLQANGSPWAAPLAPDGRQTAFIQGAGSSLSQTINLSAGSYTLTLQVARRSYNSSGVPLGLNVTVDGAQIGTAKAPSAAFSTFRIPFTVAVGAHTIALTGDAGAGDRSVFVDAVTLTGGSAPGATTTTLGVITTYTATVSGSNPTGTVKFGTIASCQAVPLVAGVATCAAPFSPGVVATYGGDATNAGSQSQ